MLIASPGLSRFIFIEGREGKNVVSPDIYGGGNATLW